MENKFQHRLPNHIPIDSLYEDFKSHLDIEDNLRIFFSAKFGSGKSYFLQDFFDSHSDKYEVINLFPINYSTASNKDIFELIKFDILFHLLRFHENKIDKVAISKFMKFQWFISAKTKPDQIGFNLEILSSMMELESIKANYPLWSNALPVIYSIYKIAKDEYSKYCKDVEDGIDKSDNFLEKVMFDLPEYGDNDPIIAIIKNTILNIYNESKGKQVVLLIDDLDRLDPEHLFRILNVFGNHLSVSSKNKINYVNENKFGFHKVILVGDISNVQGIFWHKYGNYTDFEGYFSKYYSKCIFHYRVNQILISKDLETDALKLISKQLFNQVRFPQFYNNHGEVEKEVEEIIGKLYMLFFSEGQIGLRNIMQKEASCWSRNQEYYSMTSVYSCPTYKALDYFCWFFDTKENLLTVIENCKDFSINNAYPDRMSNPFERLFEDCIVYQAKRLNNKVELDYTVKDKSSYNLKTDYLNSSKVCQLNFRIENLGTRLIPRELHYSTVEIREVYPIPQLSFKKLVNQFIRMNF